MKNKKGILQLLICAVCLVFFIKVIVPAINDLPFFEDFQAMVQKYDINCAAFFYTDDISSSSEITKYTNL